MPYTTKGSVRGSCCHKHRSLETAYKCLKSDQDGCRSQGGYSDREILNSDGSRLNEDDYYYCDVLMFANY